jgi:hypothetical protein
MLLAANRLVHLILIVAPCVSSRLLFVCDPANDLYVAALALKPPIDLQRFDSAETALQAVEGPDDALLLLAGGYPGSRTPIAAAIFDAAAKLGLYLYVEFPAALPEGIKLDRHNIAGNLTFQRLVVADPGGLGGSLAHLQLLYAHGASWASVSEYNCLPTKTTAVPPIGTRVEFNTTTTQEELCWRPSMPANPLRFVGEICGSGGQIKWDTLSNLAPTVPAKCHWNRTSIDSTAKWLGACGVAPTSINAPAFACAPNQPHQGIKPLLVSARVVGYDTATYGLDNGTSSSPILFTHPHNPKLLISTTKLSVSGAPSARSTDTVP